jgi:hypothetical protein
MNIWVSEWASNEMKMLEYIKFPATFHLNRNGLPIYNCNYGEYDAFIWSTKEFKPDEVTFLLENNCKVFLFCIHGDGFHLENRKEFLKYDNFKIITGAIDGGLAGQILEYPNTYLDVTLVLAYYYTLFAVELYEFHKTTSNKSYKVGLWHREGYRHDRDFLIKNIRNSKHSESFKILTQKELDIYDVLIGRDIESSYKQWSVQYFNFMDCELFLSFESANTDSTPFFCSDKILKGFILEALGIPTIHVLQSTLKSELEKYGFDIIGYTSYQGEIVNKLIDMNVDELKERNIKSNNLKILEDMIKGGQILNELKKIMI